VEHGPSRCDAPTIQEIDLQNAVVKAINLALGRKDSMIEVLKRNIKTVLNHGTETSVGSIDAKLESMQKELLKRANARKDYNEIVDEIYLLRGLKQDALLESAEREGLKQRISEMEEFLNEQASEIASYDEQLVRRLIEKVTVFDDKLTVEFKSGVKIDIEIECKK